MLCPHINCQGESEKMDSIRLFRLAINLQLVFVIGALGYAQNQPMSRYCIDERSSLRECIKTSNNPQLECMYNDQDCERCLKRIRQLPLRVVRRD
jgi:hypothetical protein